MEAGVHGKVDDEREGEEGKFPDGNSGGGGECGERSDDDPRSHDQRAQ